MAQENLELPEETEDFNQETETEKNKYSIREVEIEFHGKKFEESELQKGLKAIELQNLVLKRLLDEKNMDLQKDPLKVENKKRKNK